MSEKKGGAELESSRKDETSMEKPLAEAEAQSPINSTSGEQTVLLSRKILVKMFQGIRELFGSGAEVLLFELGDSVGKGLAEESGLVVDREEFMVTNAKEILGVLSAIGWGRLELTQVADDCNIVRAYENFECANHLSESPYGYFLRGILAGSFSALYGVPLQCVETQCISMGHPYCEFKITRP